MIWRFDCEGCGQRIVTQTEHLILRAAEEHLALCDGPLFVVRPPIPDDGDVQQVRMFTRENLPLIVQQRDTDDA